MGQLYPTGHSQREWMGRSLKVNKAKPKEDRGGGGGRGGYGGGGRDRY
jgi:hypothetical protein